MSLKKRVKDKKREKRVSMSQIFNTFNRASLNQFFVYIGLSSCRIYKISEEKELCEESKKQYSFTDWKSDKNCYTNKLINDIKELILTLKDKYNNRCIIKCFADVGFLEIFKEDNLERDKFSFNFYKETGLCFNIISHTQIKQNLMRLFKDSSIVDGNNTVIININSQCVDIYVLRNDGLIHYEINEVSIEALKQYVKENNISNKWDGEIELIKAHIFKQIEAKISTILAENNNLIKKAIILKGEKKFMSDNGYSLKSEGVHSYIDFNTYQDNNYTILFNVDYTSESVSKVKKEDINSIQNFKFGHILLETIMEKLNVERIYPYDEICIHGNPETAYIFNVVLSGSTHNERKKFFKKVRKKLLKNNNNNIIITSPKFVHGEIKEITYETEIEHMCAIRSCDLLLVCNLDNYIGKHTLSEIYGAYLINKFIAFVKDPGDSFEYKDYIPYDIWEE